MRLNAWAWRGFSKHIIDLYMITEYCLLPSFESSLPSSDLRKSEIYLQQRLSGFLARISAESDKSLATKASRSSVVELAVRVREDMTGIKRSLEAVCKTCPRRKSGDSTRLSLQESHQLSAAFLIYSIIVARSNVAKVEMKDFLVANASFTLKNYTLCICMTYPT